MAEVFGIIAGAVNIATTFSAVIEVFDYVQLGRRFGRDYQTSQLKLTLLRLRLSRWGEAVDVYNDPQLGDPSATPTEIKVAKDTLQQILALFEDSCKTSRKFGVRDAAGSPRAVDPAAEPDLAAALAVENKMKSLAKRRQKGSSFSRLTSWAVHHGAALKTLIDDISALAGELEALFPAPKERTRALAEREVSVVQGEGEAKALALASDKLDEVIHEAVAAAGGGGRRGHTYKGVEISDAAVVANGTAYFDNFNYGAAGPGGELRSGASHLYEGVKIEGNGKTVVLNGDRYGGVDPFAVMRG